MGFLDKMKQAAEGVQAQTSKVGVGADRGQIDLANKAKMLMSEGVDTPAHIDGVHRQERQAGRHRAHDHRDREARRRRPYEVTFNQYIYPSAPFSAGEHVMVKVAPYDPNTVMLWGKP